MREDGGLRQKKNPLGIKDSGILVLLLVQLAL